MKKRIEILAALVVGGAAWATELPPVQYVNGIPACPSDQDLKNIDTRLSARVIPADNRAALQQEKAKATRCRMTGTRYLEFDWKRMEAVIRGDS